MAGLCLLAVGTAACAGPKHAAVKAPPTTPVPTTTTTAPPPPVYPLTGLPVTDPASAGRPALNVKIDNAPQARPQSGLDKADVVYEEVVEGGITRYLAVFQSHDAAPLGPIRSVRMTDADVVHPIGGLFAYSGGIPAFINDVRAAGVIDVGANADPSAYTRSNSRQSPHNLYSSTSVLRQATPAGLGPPKPVFAYRQVAAPFGGTGVAPISHFQVSMSPSVTSEWDWDPATARWLRSINGAPQVATDGVRIAFANVIIEMVPYHNTGFVDPAGNPVPDASVVGNGPAVVLSGGSMLSGSWSKASPAAVTTFADSAGTPVLLTPGTTWIELAPSGSPTASH
ncbi:MAG: DUF3048 domain-containing protein [Acidimicrobiales bacterium]